MKGANICQIRYLPNKNTKTGWDYYRCSTHLLDKLGVFLGA